LHFPTRLDLFWALRGGGGNFGVVTALELQLYPIADAYAGVLFFPVERGVAIWVAETLARLKNVKATWTRGTCSARTTS
jgi:FAD/FMN-containing dehydrogenase